MFAYEDKIAGEAKELGSRDISFHRKAVMALAVFLVIVWFFPHKYHVSSLAAFAEVNPSCTLLMQ
jgi:hypothetical protein